MISDVVNMDCMAYMAQFPDKFFDLAVVDPPSGIKDNGKTIKIWKVKSLSLKFKKERPIH